MDKNSYSFYFLLLLAGTIIFYCLFPIIQPLNVSLACESLTECRSLIITNASNLAFVAMLLIPISFAVILYKRLQWLGFNDWWLRGLIAWAVVAAKTLSKNPDQPNDPIFAYAGIPTQLIFILILGLYFCFAEKVKPFQTGFATHTAWIIAGIQAGLATRASLLPYGWILLSIFSICLGYLLIEQYRFKGTAPKVNKGLGPTSLRA